MIHINILLQQNKMKMHVLSVYSKCMTEHNRKIHLQNSQMLLYHYAVSSAVKLSAVLYLRYKITLILEI